MDMLIELKGIQSLLLNRIAVAVSKRDLAAVTALSGLAKECEAIEAEMASLSRRVEIAKGALNGSSGSQSGISGTVPDSVGERTLSYQAAGAIARSKWVEGLRLQGITLSGRRKRYLSAQGLSVGLTFANELPRFIDQWFLGLRDEPTEIAVLLCQSLAGQLHDIVLPASCLSDVWQYLSRHGNEVKLHVKKNAKRLLFLVPGNKPLDVTGYVGNYEPLFPKP